ncbi:hypothetical protein GTY75_20925 [Streptomyces sp. SID8381]|uniref:PqqD family protein n=1 Tax=unclassified Streptomyces TaxID=2593676 RepID=UPI001319D2A3|nr:PqqD family protein [Streptomyces sp. Amel2xE9]MYX29065.1 hypothetical protein [Streptomyces sp. SID8381]
MTRVDQILVSDRHFGDSHAIEARNLARLRVGLGLLAAEEPGERRSMGEAAALDDVSMRRLMYDPVLRNAFEDAIAMMENGLDGGAALEGYLRHVLQSGRSGLGPCERISSTPRRAWPRLGPAWILGSLSPEDPAEERLADRMRELYAGSFDGGAADPIKATDAMAGALSAGADLLTALLPETGASVLRHVALVGFTRGESADGPLQSLSGGDPLPSAILMAPERLENSWVAAETLLHESAHLKLFDALRAGAVTTEPNLLVPIPWRTERWRLIRVLVALHFYTHLLVFQEAAANAGAELTAVHGERPADEEVDEATPGTPAASAGTHQSAAERVAYLAECAVGEWRHLTPHGRRLVRWMFSVLGRMLPEAPEAPEDRDPIGSAGMTAAGDSAALEAEAGYGRTGEIQAFALEELGELVVGDARTGRMHWLNAHSWLLYSLCDGGPLDGIESAYAARVGAAVPADEVRRRVRAGLSDLAASGLIGVRV